MFMVAALIMGLLVIAGAGWFFQDQLKAAWRVHQQEKSPEQSDPSVASTEPEAKKEATAPESDPPETIAKPQDLATRTFDPTAPPKQTPPQPSESPTPQLGNASGGNRLNMTSPPVMIPPKLDPPPATDLMEVPTPPSVIPKAMPAPSEMVEITVKATPETQSAVAMLKKFFAAKDWKERLKYVQLPDQMQPNMEDYYAANKDGPILINRIELLRHEKAADGDVPHSVFEVAGPDLETPLPIMVADSKDGGRVDWLTFTEFKDRLLLKFGQTYTEQPARFHVMMRKFHYFDDDVPQRDSKQCYELQPPMPGFMVNVFVEKSSALAKELDRRIIWDVTSAAIVELKWRKQDNYQWIELVDVPQYHWRSVPPGEQLVAKPAANK